MTIQTPATPALAAFAVVLGGGILLGETFPFSRFSMYSGISEREQGVTPVFLANGVVTPVEGFDRFVGLDPAGFRAPQGIPTTMDYQMNDIRAWVSAHEAETSCDVRAELAWVISTRGKGGVIDQVTVVASSGRACRR